MGLFDTKDSSDSDEESTDSSYTGGFTPKDEVTTGIRVIDEEAGVVIYQGDIAFAEGGGKGMAAVPLKDTNLTIENKDEDKEVDD